MTAGLDHELVRHDLTNGMQLAIAPVPTAPGVGINIWFEVGSYDEQPGLTGLAHLFEHLMFSGSAQVGASEHMATIERLGGTVNATTSTDRTNYFETVPTGALELALWLEAERMGSLSLTHETFTAQRAVVKEEKRQRYDNQPFGDALELLVAQHFPTQHPYGHLPIGSMADLDRAELADVQAFFGRWYAPSNARMVITGAVAPDAAIELVERHFGDLAERPHPGHDQANTDLLEPRHTTVTRPVPYDLLYATWPVPAVSSPHWVAVELALRVLADGQTSRLHKRLVRETGLAREVHASLLPHLRASSIAALVLRPRDRAAVPPTLDAVADEIHALAVAGPTDDQLSRVKATYERELLTELSTLEGRADALNDAWLTLGSPSRLSDRLAELAATSAEDVASAAGDLDAVPSVLSYEMEDPA
ncbi:MAG: M16 family metallopeptidase [Arachnia sp.]